MRHQLLFAKAAPQSPDWDTRWEGPDKGLVCSWLRGIEKAKGEPELRVAAQRGELPVLPWKGGGKPLKSGTRVGALHYLAMWQGLRGDDLDVDDAGGAQLTCALTGTVVTFSADAQALARAAAEAGGPE